MATLHTNPTLFSPNSKPGPWSKPVLARLRQALVVLTTQAQVLDGVVGVVLFGSYARGEFGRKSDVDVLVLVQPGEDLHLVGGEARHRQRYLVAIVRKPFDIVGRVVVLAGALRRFREVEEAIEADGRTPQGCKIVVAHSQILH